MKQVTAREARTIMLDILLDVSRFCDENNLTYFLAYGSLIGAVRHKGFIPWDDDIDLLMPRPDYDRFMELYRTKGHYSLQSPMDKGAVHEWIKISDDRTLKIEAVDYSVCKPLGVNIDIFPIDGQPDNMETFRRETDERMRLHHRIEIITRPLKGFPLKGKIATLVYRLIGVRHYLKKYNQSATKYPYETASYVGYTNPYPWKLYSDRHPKSLFEGRVKVPFEGYEFWAPAGYDTFLRNIYGDYMQLPPVEKQVTHHDHTLYWKD